MKGIRLFSVGLLFGIIMFKSQAVSWYRIFEMFRFESFHMYGIIGTAVALGLVAVQLIKRYKMKDVDGVEITFTPKHKSYWRYILGGTIFGLGWALSGACPGPMFVLVGTGVWSILIVIAGALIGTFLYGLLRAKLPH